MYICKGFVINFDVKKTIILHDFSHKKFLISLIFKIIFNIR